MRAFVARRSARTWVIIAAIVVVVAVLAVWWFAFALPSQARASAPITRTETVAATTLQKTVSGTGTLTPTVSDDVSFGASGTVTAVDVAAGNTVTAGQTLATVDPLDANANLLSAQATLAAANAKLANAQSASDGSASAVAQIAADQAAVNVAQASVTTAQTEVNATTLTAPAAGLITAVNVAVGDTVSGSSGSSGSSSSSGSSGSSSTTSGSAGGTGSSATGSGSTGTSGTSTSGTSTGSSSSSAAFTIVGTASWTLTVDVSAASVKNIATGDQVQLSTTENTSFFGTVSSIGLLPTTSDGAAVYPVVVAVTGSPTNLYDGVSVTADIVYQRIANALTVPSAAITTKNGTSTVVKVVNGKNVTTPVTLGQTVGQVTQITKGLSSGDQVVVTVFTPGANGTGGTGTGGRTFGGFGGEGGFGGGGRTGGTGGTGGEGGFGGGTGGTGTGTGGGFGGFGGGTRTGGTNG